MLLNAATEIIFPDVLNLIESELEHLIFTFKNIMYLFPSFPP